MAVPATLQPLVNLQVDTRQVSTVRDSSGLGRVVTLAVGVTQRALGSRAIRFIPATSIETDDEKEVEIKVWNWRSDF